MTNYMFKKGDKVKFIDNGKFEKTLDNGEKIKVDTAIVVDVEEYGVIEKYGNVQAVDLDGIMCDDNKTYNTHASEFLELVED